MRVTTAEGCQIAGLRPAEIIGSWPLSPLRKKEGLVEVAYDILYGTMISRQGLAVCLPMRRPPDGNSTRTTRMVRSDLFSMCSCLCSTLSSTPHTLTIELDKMDT